VTATCSERAINQSDLDSTGRATRVVRPDFHSDKSLTGCLSDLILKQLIMANNIPNPPGGALPPKKETGKVQPKKETVRINLPPKPTAAPTIKLPTLPPGGPTGAGAPTPGAAPAAAAAPPAPAAPASRATAAPIAQRPAAPAPKQAPARPAPAVAKSSGLDTGLAIAAAVAGLIAVASVVIIMMIETT